MVGRMGAFIGRAFGDFSRVLRTYLDDGWTVACVTQSNRISIY